MELADIRGETNRVGPNGRVAIGVAMLEFPNKRTGPFVHEIPRPVNAGNAAGTGIVRKRFICCQQHAGVVDAEAEPIIFFEVFFYQYQVFYHQTFFLESS